MDALKHIFLFDLKLNLTRALRNKIYLVKVENVRVGDEGIPAGHELTLLSINKTLLT